MRGDARKKAVCIGPDPSLLRDLQFTPLRGGNIFLSGFRWREDFQDFV